MVNMSEDRSASPKMDSSKKMCPRAARETTRKTETYVRKPAHTGLRFHFDKKKLTTHEFHFNTVSKTEKTTRCRHLDKSLERPSNAENRTSAESKKIEVLMDTLKISKSEECSGREKSPLRKEIPKSPVVERLLTKKACTRCSRCSKAPKEDKSEAKPTKPDKNQDKHLKTTKKENHSAKTFKLTPQFPKPAENKKPCSKLTKVLVESQEKVSKPKSIVIHNEKPSLHDEKNDALKNSGPPKSPKPTECKKQCSKLAKILAEPPEKNMNAKTSTFHTEKIISKNCEKTLSITEKTIVEKSHSVNEKKVEFWPGSGEPVNMSVRPETHVLHDKGNPEIVNGTEHLAESDTKVCLLNGRHDEHLCDPHLGLESPSGTKTSKIPRKTPGATAVKPEVSFNKEVMSEELIAL